MDVTTRNTLIAETYREGYTIKDCAEKFNVPIGSVRHALKTNNVEPRARSYRSNSNRVERLK